MFTLCLLALLNGIPAVTAKQTLPASLLLSCPGNRLWEWFSVGRWGLKGYNFKDKKFEGELWPGELGKRHDHAGNSKT
jgi:hypothetical protein